MALLKETEIYGNLFHEFIVNLVFFLISVKFLTNSEKLIRHSEIKLNF